ncbi:class I adenylate-forming enzyme family protein [Streptomyces sp. NPDC050560]|uniref:class I adenylate-forming enzyme family protein n=1 Tax=Streptomyces sp. NPDC050560 TaxID=3365630 RepID=UPI00379E2BB1
MARARTPNHLGELFEWHAGRSRQTVMHVDRPFDIAPDAGTVLDGARLAALVREASGWLHAAGLRHGDRVAIVKENHYDTVIVAAGAARMGALPVMIAPITATGSIRTMIDRIGPRLVVLGAAVVARAAVESCELVGSGQRTVVLGEPGVPLPGDALRLADVLGAAPAPVRMGAADEPMVVTHSSGTTGVPKLVVHSAATAVGAQARLESSRLPVVVSRRSDVTASAISFAHFRVLSWTAGQLRLAPRRMVVLSDPAPERVAEMLSRHRPSVLEACPNIFQRWEELADLRPALFARVRLFVTTFDAVHPRTVRAFLSASERKLPLWAHGWGQSETGPLCSNLFTRRSVRPRPSAGERAGTHGVTNEVGWPLLCRVRAVDPATGRTVRRGEPGLLMASSAGRCLDYLGESDRHRAKLDGRWWNTGDLGRRVGLFRFSLIDREVDMIPGLSCIELESVLLDRLPRATEVVVLAVRGELPVPVLAIRDGQLDSEEWRLATEGLPALGRPRILPWDEMPRTATWKVRRIPLREKVLGPGESFGTGRWT